MKTIAEICEVMLATGMVDSQRDFSRKMGCPPAYYGTVLEKTTVGPLFVLWQHLESVGAHGLAKDVFQLIQAKAAVRPGPHKNKRRKHIEHLAEVA